MIKPNLYIIALFSCLSFYSCTKEFEKIEPPKPSGTGVTQDNEQTKAIADIDLNHWKVTLPVGNPTEVAPPEILDYANNEELKGFMYNDHSDTSIVFYTYPGGATTTNSSYPRTELREQMVSGSNSTNWTFAQGGKMRGTLSVPSISTDSNGNTHRTIIMQIHGRLTNEQRDLIGASDNNAPPILKIYWAFNKVRVKTKILKNINIGYPEILKTDSWTDDEGIYFDQEVGTDKFTLEIEVSEGKMIVSLNDTETLVYDGVHIEKWGLFENYFKAGNYLSTKEEGANSTVKYYDLTVAH